MQHDDSDKIRSGESPDKEPDSNSLSLTKSVRFSIEQWKRIETAARAESDRAGVRIDPTSLFRDLGMQGIERILAENPVPQSA